MKPFIYIITILTAIAANACTSAQSVSFSATPGSHLTEANTVQTKTPFQSAFAVTSTPKKTTLPPEVPTPIPTRKEVTQIEPTPQNSATRRTVIPSLTLIPTPTTVITMGPDEWKDLPIIPKIDDEMLKVYARGLEAGNNPLAFSKIGDCGSTPAWFLGDFDRGPRYYELGEYEYLEDVIQYFQGSFDRTSLAARSGFNASALFVPLWADREYCESSESPLACEYRVHKPIAAFIMLGTNDVWRPAEFEPQMRKIIEFSIDEGVVPILVTKADNQEEDGSINATIARLASEYQVPLWNYWKAVNGLPDGGLQEDGVHLTWGPNHFDDPDAMSNAWPVRNLTALQVLHELWQKVYFQQ